MKYVIIIKQIVDEQTAIVDVDLGFDTVKVNQTVKFKPLTGFDSAKLMFGVNGDDVLMRVINKDIYPYVEFFANERHRDIFGHVHKNMCRVDTSPVDS